ncbi:MAG: shikimate dehydrogenase [Thermoplasmata archaeon]|nr:MAG: shikimate dehydrogenase [Thermoplasmata archaeon]
MTLTCTTIVEPKLDEMILAAYAAQEIGTDLIELRLDYLEKIDLFELLPIKEEVSVRLIATLRPQIEGGQFSGAESDRFELLEECIESEIFDFIDCELSSEQTSLEDLIDVARAKGVKTIVSHHDLEGTPTSSEFIEILNKCLALGDIAKIGVTVKSRTDFSNFLAGCRTAWEAEHNFTGVCLNGAASYISRILAPHIGSWAVYASLTPEKKAVPEQITLLQLKNAWKAMAVDPSAQSELNFVDEHTKIYGLLGQSLAYTHSPLMHNAAFKSEHLESIYIPFDIPQDLLGQIINDSRTLNISGLNVTIPFKESVMEYLDELDEGASKINAVNTIVNSEGVLKGYNTDSYGAMQALKSANIEPKEKKVMVFGAGGAAKALCFGLISEGASVSVANRTEARAAELKALYPEIEVVDFQARNEAVTKHDIIINCTPTGTAGFDADDIFDYNNINNDHTVFDLVYNPRKTKLLEAAEQKGAKIVSGIDMLLHQALKSFKIWTDINIEADLMRSSL